MQGRKNENWPGRPPPSEPRPDRRTQRGDHGTQVGHVDATTARASAPPAPDPPPPPSRACSRPTHTDTWPPNLEVWCALTTNPERGRTTKPLPRGPRAGRRRAQ